MMYIQELEILVIDTNRAPLGLACVACRLNDGLINFFVGTPRSKLGPMSFPQLDTQTKKH